MLDFIDNKPLSRIINKEKSEDYPIPFYGINGILLGYEESDVHFRKRIVDEFKKRRGFEYEPGTRGLCKEFAEQLAEEKGYRLVRGWYYEPHWGKKEQHWWCVDDKGNIHDPTAEQFPSGGIKEFYTEYTGTVECGNCGEIITESEIIWQGYFPVCSDRCALDLVGL